MLDQPASEFIAARLAKVVEANYEKCRGEWKPVTDEEYKTKEAMQALISKYDAELNGSHA